MTAKATNPARTAADLASVRGAVLRWFAAHGRDLPWRRTRDPWAVLVSELMLQQTQVDRVVPKYLAFLERWPTPAALADAPLSEVLAAWSGLGYNRRAKHLREAAVEIRDRFGGAVPLGVEDLESLSGVGRYTARAVASFAGNADVALWDTNVRRIFMRVLHGGEFAAPLPSDAELEATLERALPRGRSRDWHGALMDFGSAVCTGRTPSCAACPLRKRCAAAPSFISGRSPRASLVRPQAKFEGSRRQTRGMLVRILAERGGMTEAGLLAEAGRPDGPAALADLEREGMVVRRRGRVALP